jgi:hypothetical protein
MNTYRDLSEQEQKEFCFQIISRLQHHPEVYDKIKKLLKKYPAPFTDDNHVRILKPEFCEVC